MFAKWGERNMIRLVFPGLYSEDRSTPFLTQDEQRILYQDGIAPAVKSLTPHTSHDWPPSYDDEMFRARKNTGTLVFTPKILGSWLVPLFGDALRKSLEENGVDWGNNFMFLHQVRGTKHGTGHGMNSHSAREAREEYLRKCELSLDVIEQGTWWIDIGLEFFSSREECLQWRTDSHCRVVQQIASIPPTAARRITTIGSSKYDRDLVSHLTQISGCRIEPGVRAQGPKKIAYIQLYTTDKSLTYNPEGKNFGKTFPYKAGITKHDQTSASSYLKGLYKLYINSSLKKASHARLEIRVPFEFSTEALLEFPTDLLRRSLVSFPKNVWWYVTAPHATIF